MSNSHERQEKTQWYNYSASYRSMFLAWGRRVLVIKQLSSETGCWKVRYWLTVLQRAVLQWLPFVPFHVKVLVTNITSNNILQEQSLFPSLGMGNSFLQDFLTTVITIRAFPSDLNISGWLGIIEYYSEKQPDREALITCGWATVHWLPVLCTALSPFLLTQPIWLSFCSGI